MSYQTDKPRLEFYRALLSYATPDLDFIKKAFVYWATFTEYLIFRKENIYTYETQYKAVKASKRGNDVYAWRLRKRLQFLKKLPEISFFDHRDRSRRHKTRVLFIGFTYRRDLRLDEAWELVGRDFNRTISALRRRFGKIHIMRTWEAHNDGYPHIHCILYFEEYEFDVFFYNGKWRAQKRDEVLKFWPWGHGDVLGIYSLGGGVGYVSKYITKNQFALLEGDYNQKAVLSLAMMWIFKKRAFSLSRGFEDIVVEEEKEERRYVGQVDLEGNPIIQWVLVGFWAGNLGVWSKELKYREFFKIYGSKEFSLKVDLV
jgi:hypothetical protein